MKRNENSRVHEAMIDRDGSALPQPGALAVDKVTGGLWTVLMTLRTPDAISKKGKILAEVQPASRTSTDAAAPKWRFELTEAVGDIVEHEKVFWPR